MATKTHRGTIQIEIENEGITSSLFKQYMHALEKAIPQGVEFDSDIDGKEALFTIENQPASNRNAIHFSMMKVLNALVSDIEFVHSSSTDRASSISSLWTDDPQNKLLF